MTPGPVEQCAPDEHVWGPDVLHAGKPGTAMDGHWLVAACRACNTGRLRPAGGGRAVDLLVAQLENLGCNPRPAGTP
jgi:hypothetical protein